ncbi:MAG: hypothetical protein Q9227_008392 [Pyrenula ochraceoflavens]
MSFLTRTLLRPLSHSHPSSSSSLRRSYAKLAVIGNIVADPTTSTSSNGQEVIRYVIANNYGPRDNRRVSYFRVTGFPATEVSRNLMKSLSKGTMVHVEADATMGTYDDKDTGKTLSSLNLVQRSVEILRRPAPKGEGEAAGEDGVVLEEGAQAANA